MGDGGIGGAGPEARIADVGKGQALPERADAEGMARTARTLLKALQAADEVALFELLAPWQQQAEALKQQRLLRTLQGNKDEWTFLAARMKRKKLDTGDKFKLKSPEALKRLNPPTYSALMAGMYR